MRKNWKLNLHRGDEITWKDPDNGLCSRTGKILVIEYPSNQVAIVTWEDGITTEILLKEIS